MTQTKTLISLRLDNHLLAWVDEIAQREGSNRTVVIEGLIAHMREEVVMNVEVQVLFRGQAMRPIYHEGKTFLLVDEAGDFVVRLRNNSSLRRLAVLTVDGVNVVDGETAGYDGPGYVLDPYMSSDITGWKREGGKAAHFTFVSQEESYAAQTGRPRNTGVIAAAIFAEQQRDLYTKGITRGGGSFGGLKGGGRTLTASVPRGGGFLGGGGPTYATNSVQPSSSIIGSRESLGGSVGAGYGTEHDFRTTTVSFEKATAAPAEVITIYYGTREQLLAWGVPEEKLASPQALPSGFPASEPSVKAPPGWRG